MSCLLFFSEYRGGGTGGENRKKQAKDQDRWAERFVSHAQIDRQVARQVYWLFSSSASASSNPSAKLSISGTFKVSSSSSMLYSWPPAFSLKGFFPPSGRKLLLRFLNGFASGPNCLRLGLSFRVRSMPESGREKSRPEPMPPGDIGRDPMGRGPEGEGRGAYPPPGEAGRASLARASLTASGRPLNGWLLNRRIAS